MESNNGNSNGGSRAPLPSDFHATSPSCKNSSHIISVVIPAYRCSQYIAQAVQSVLAQTFPACEVIVVNDGSPDTPLLEAALAPYKETIRYIKQDTRGPSGARNSGIEQARGNYIAFLDGDDYWCSDHLARQVAVLREDPTLDLVYCDSILVKDERPFARAFDIEPQCAKVTFESLLVEDSAISTSSTVVSRSAIMAVGMFDENFTRCEDFDTWLRMSFAGARVAFHSDARVYHRISDTGLSADRWSMKKDRIRVYQKVAATLPISAQQRQIVHEMIAKTQAQYDIERMKHALEVGDYNEAVQAANHARILKNSWKVKVSLFCLRTFPRLFRRLHLARIFLLGRNKHSTKQTSYLTDAQHSGVVSDQSTRVEAVAASAEVAPRGRS
jgi:glycosyltransferase involved in cell wall biosynthesis